MFAEWCAEWWPTTVDLRPLSRPAMSPSPHPCAARVRPMRRHDGDSPVAPRPQHSAGARHRGEGRSGGRQDLQAAVESGYPAASPMSGVKLPLRSRRRRGHAYRSGGVARSLRCSISNVCPPSAGGLGGGSTSRYGICVRRFRFACAMFVRWSRAVDMVFTYIT